MSARLLLTSAGNGPSNNLARSLRAGFDSVFIAGCNSDQFSLKKSDADVNYLVPPVGHPEWAQALRRIIKARALHLIIPTVDSDVMALSQARRHLAPYLFLPRASVLETCADKYRLIALLRRNGVDAPETYPVKDPKRIPAIFQQLGKARPLWCRVRRGAGALGALPVRTPGQARNWIRYWQEMRGVNPTAFVLSEYLPGRDFGCQSVWRNGKPLLVKTYERLSYLGTGSQPAEVSSVAALAKTVFEQRVVDTSVRAIRLLDAGATGAFSVDLKENRRGDPCITEINAGRFSSATNIFDLVGKHNMTTTFVRLARGQPVKIQDPYDAAPDWYMLRDIDGPPRIFHASKFFDKVDGVGERAGSRQNRQRSARRGKRVWRTSKSTNG